MAQLDAVIVKRSQTALAVVSRLVPVVRAYLFGSQVEGTADRWSDIDLAVFVEGIESWDLHDRARAAAQVQKEAGDEVEVHFLPAETLKERDPAGFAAWVLAHGVEVPA
ncbi:MAG: nucleotidyltransferase domain-containing protein [Pseudomonadota bacterium]